MPQSPELAGGEGFTFEGDAAAFYLAALLAEGYAPGIDDRMVARVAVRQRDFGEPLDDLIVDFEGALGNPARLSLQVKRSLTIGKAKSNEDFRDIIRDSWATLRKLDFRRDVDRYGAAVGTMIPAKERALRLFATALHQRISMPALREAETPARPKRPSGRTSQPSSVSLKVSPCTSEEVHQFLAHFVLMR